MRKKRPLASPPPSFFLSSSLSFPSLLSRPRNPLSSCLHPPQSLLISPISPPPHPFRATCRYFPFPFFCTPLPLLSPFRPPKLQASFSLLRPPSLPSLLPLSPPSSSPPPLDPHSPEIARKGVYVFLSPLFSLCPLFSPPLPLFSLLLTGITPTNYTDAGTTALSPSTLFFSGSPPIFLIAPRSEESGRDAPGKGGEGRRKETDPLFSHSACLRLFILQKSLLASLGRGKEKDLSRGRPHGWKKREFFLIPLLFSSAGE